MAYSPIKLIDALAEQLAEWPNGHVDLDLDYPDHIARRILHQDYLVRDHRFWRILSATARNPDDVAIETVECVWIDAIRRDTENRRDFGFTELLGLSPSEWGSLARMLEYARDKSESDRERRRED
jgi:hypothetical protein